MANTGFKGVDVRQTGNQLVFRALLQDSTNALLTSGTTTFRLYELQSDGTIKSYDFNDNTFKTTALTTATLAATHRQGNNATVNTGIWTAILSTLTGFTVGGQYFVAVNNTGASPADQVREFIYGSAEGDLVVTAISTGVGELTAINDFTTALPASPTAGTVGEAFFFALNRLGRRGTAQAGASSTITLDSGASAVDNIYQTHSIRITSGTGSGQIATITGYVGSTKVATITRPGGGTWSTNPDNTSVFQIEAVPLASVGFILFTLLTETAGQLAAGFKKFFNVAVPVHTVASVDQTGDSFARVGNAGAGLTSLGDTRIGNLDAAISTRLATSGYTAPTNPTDYARNNVAPSWWTAPDNADVVTSLADLVSLLARTDPNTAIAALQTTANAIKAKTDNLPALPASTTNITAGTISTVTNLTNAPTAGDLTATMKASVAAAVPTAAAIDTQLSGTHGVGVWGGAGGAGARVVTVHVTDGTSVLQGAFVRMTTGISTFLLQTDSSGNAVFALDDGSYTLAVTKGGYSYTPTTQTISGTATIAAVMTAIVIPGATNPLQSNAWIYTYDGQGAIETGVVLTFQLSALPAGETLGAAGKNSTFTATSDGTGLLSALMIRGATYSARRQNGRSVSFVVDDATTYELPSILGHSS